MSAVIRKNSKSKKVQLTIMVDEEYKIKFDQLSQERKISMSEHSRKVLYPEIDRVWSLEMTDAS